MEACGDDLGSSGGQAANPLAVLIRLCDEEPLRFPSQALEVVGDAQSIQLLIGAGLLVEAGNSQWVRCTACDEHHELAVEHLGRGRYRGYCHEAGFVRVPAECLRTWTVDLRHLADLLARNLGIRRRELPEEVIDDHLFYLGSQRIHSYRTRLFLGRRLDDPGVFEQVSQALEKRYDGGPTILLATTDWRQVQRALPSRHALVSLQDACSWLGREFRVDENVLLQRLRGHDPRFHAGGIGYVFSPGFRSAVVGDQKYQFTKKQAEVVEVLFGAFTSGLGKMHQDEVMGMVDSSQRIGQLFQGNPAYGTLIMNDSQGYYWLSL